MKQGDVATYLKNDVVHLQLCTTFCKLRASGNKNRVKKLEPRVGLSIEIIHEGSHTGVSKNNGTPKWMLYKGNPY